MTTIYRTAQTADGGFVVRRLHFHWIGDEEAWKLFPPKTARETWHGTGGHFARSIGHNGPWVVCQWSDIPEPVRRRFRAMRDHPHLVNVEGAVRH